MTIVCFKDILLGLARKPVSVRRLVCSLQHSTYLHPQSVKSEDTANQQSKKKTDDESVGGNTAGGQNGYVKTKDRCRHVTGAGVSEIGMPIVPVPSQTTKFPPNSCDKARNSHRTVVT